MFRGSPIKRIGRDRFVRNVLYAIGNSGDPALAEVARGLADDGVAVERCDAPEIDDGGCHTVVGQHIGGLEATVGHVGNRPRRDRRGIRTMGITPVDELGG